MYSKSVLPAFGSAVSAANYTPFEATVFATNFATVNTADCTSILSAILSAVRSATASTVKSAHRSTILPTDPKPHLTIRTAITTAFWAAIVAA